MFLGFLTNIHELLGISLKQSSCAIFETGFKDQPFLTYRDYLMTQIIHKRLIYIWGKLTGRQPSTIIPYEELTNLLFHRKNYYFLVFDKCFTQF